MLGLRKLPTVMAATTMALTVTGSRVSAKDLKSPSAINFTQAMPTVVAQSNTNSPSSISKSDGLLIVCLSALGLLSLGLLGGGGEFATRRQLNDLTTKELKQALHQTGPKDPRHELIREILTERSQR